MAKLALQAEGHELELLAAVEGEDEEEGEEGEHRCRGNRLGALSGG